MPGRENEFDLNDAVAVHHAMLEAVAQAVERRVKMPSSSDALTTQAQRLRVVRNKIIERLSESDRANFPRYRLEATEAGRE